MTAAKLRIVLCTRGGLHGAVVLHRLLASPRAHVVGVVLSTRILGPHHGWLSGSWRHLRRSGLAYALYLAASTWLADLSLRLGGGNSVARRAALLEIPLLPTRGIDGPSGLGFVARCAPDLLVSAFFDQRIPESIARLPGFGALNIHPSPLPDFRGVDPVFFATLNGAGERGVSVHLVAPEFDAGDLVVREVVAPVPGDSILRATARLYARGAELLLESLDRAASGWNATPQQGPGTYDSWPTRPQVEAMRSAGGRLARAGDVMRARHIVESDANP